MKRWTKPFVHNNRVFEAVFFKDPCRERFEAAVEIEGTTLSVKDVNLNEQGFIERLKDKIDKAVIAASGVS